MPVPSPLILGAVQAGSGLLGRILARRKKYEIPDEVRQATTLASLMAQQEAPGSTQARGDIRIAAANALATARETGGAQTQLAGIVGAQRSQLRDLASTQAEYSLGAMDRYRGALETMAQYEDLQQQINEIAPFKDAARLAEDVFGAGIQNLFEGLQMTAPVIEEEETEEEETEEEETEEEETEEEETIRDVGATTQYSNPYMSAIMNLYNR